MDVGEVLLVVLAVLFLLVLTVAMISPRQSIQYERRVLEAVPFKLTGVSVPVGRGNNYGGGVELSPGGGRLLLYFRLRITVSGSLATLETITTESLAF